MFPMISGVEELKAAKQVLIQAKNELNDEKRAFTENIQVGIMIEIPSAAITADILAKEVDFSASAPMIFASTHLLLTG